MIVLDKIQSVAVHHEGNCVLLACAGSGKTRVIVAKILKEIEKLRACNSRRKVLAITFTNKAADEILSRLDSFGIDEHLWIGTIHSFCLEWILKPNASLSNETKNGFSICDVAEELEIVRKSQRFTAYGNVSLKFDRQGKIVESNQPHIVSAYHTHLLERKLIDYDQILNISNQLLIKYKSLSSNLSSIFSFIAIDEYQDTQDLQYSILREICASSNDRTKIMFVGDPNQEIFSTLGGCYKDESLIKQEFSFFEFEVFELNTNYRSHKRIVEFAENFRIYKSGVGSRINCLSGQEGVVSFSRVDVTNLMEYIESIIDESIRKGIDQSEICILAPQWPILKDVVKRLKVSRSDLDFDASDMTPISNSNKDNFFYKVSRLFLTKNNPRLYAKRQLWAADLLNNTAEFGFSAISRDLLFLINSIESNEVLGKEYIVDCCEKFIEKTHINVSDCEYLFNQWQSFCKRLNENTSEISTAEDLKGFYRESTGIKVSTIHGVKGDEFQTVIIFGLLDSIIPSHYHKCIDTAKKLMYVASTRAKENLYIICESNRRTKNGYVYNPSPILNGLIFDYDDL